ETSVSVSGGGTLQTVDSTPFSTAATVTLNGGTLELTNINANIAATATTLNYAGGSYVSLQDGPQNYTQLTVTNLNRSNQGTLVLEQVNGQLGVLGLRGERMIATNINGQSTTTQLNQVNTNGLVAPSIIYGTQDPSNNGTLIGDFVSYSGPQDGFVPFTGSVANLSGNNPNLVAVIPGATLTGSNQIYAVETTDDISGGTLQITSVSTTNMGALLINGGAYALADGTSTTGNGPVISSNLIFGDPSNGTANGEGLVYVKGGYAGVSPEITSLLPTPAYASDLNLAAITGTITAMNLTKYGAGDLLLSNPANYVSGNVTGLTGILTVQQGTLLFASGGIGMPALANLVVNDTGTLDLAGSNTIVPPTTNNFTALITNPGLQGLSGMITVGSLSGTGIVTNSSSSLTILNDLSLQSTTFSQLNGAVPALIEGNVQLQKEGVNSLTIFGDNTFTGGVSVVQGTLVSDSPLSLGGAGGTTAGAITLLSGATSPTLDLFADAGVNGVVVYGNQNGLGSTLNVNGAATVNVDRFNTSTGNVSSSGNVIQLGNLNLGNQLLTVTGADSYQLRFAGTITLGGPTAEISTASASPSGSVQLTGLIQDPVGSSGALNKTGGAGATRGTLAILESNNNTYTGGTNVLQGALQITNPANVATGSPVGTGLVTIDPGAFLRIADTGVGVGVSSPLGSAPLQVLSQLVSSTTASLGAVVLDNSTTSLNTASNFTNATTSTMNSVYGGAVQVTGPEYSGSINEADIGNGRVILGAYNTTDFTGTLSPGLLDAANAPIPLGAENVTINGSTIGAMYRLGGDDGASLQFPGQDNILTGDASVQYGSPLNRLAAVTNGDGTVILRSSADYTGNTTIFNSTTVQFESGGGAAGSISSGSIVGAGNTPFGVNAYVPNAATGYNGGAYIEVFGAIEAQGLQGSFYNSVTQSNANVILRPGGSITIDYAASLFGGAGGQGRWADSQGLDVNGGTLRLNGNATADVNEVMGAITFSKGSTIILSNQNTAFATTLTTPSLTRTSGPSANNVPLGNGTLLFTDSTVTNVTGASATLQQQGFGATEILTVTGGIAAITGGLSGNLNVGETNAAGQSVATQMLAPFMLDSTDIRFLSFDGTNNVITEAPFSSKAITASSATDIVNVSAAVTLGAGATYNAYALESNQTFTSPSGALVT
ncbi:MAG TPA: hypothetical protein VIK18_21805, partial [Pirellulales bacterium]